MNLTFFVGKSRIYAPDIYLVTNILITHSLLHTYIYVYIIK